MYKSESIKVPRFCEKEGLYTTKAISKSMGKIRSKDTECELKLRKALWKLGYRYRKNVNTIPGKPDLVFMKYKTVVFIDGDFWHGYNWQKKRETFSTNSRYWIPKIEKNILRDHELTEILTQEGFKVVRLWEHEINKNLQSCTDIIISILEERKTLIYKV